jgi:predicted AAA+ superfamily ATPase
MRAVSESLAGRIALLELDPLLASEVPELPISELWLRGGLPPVTLEPARFPAWSRDYLQNRVQRDLPLWGWTATPQQTERLLRMLAAVHGQQWNASQLAASLGLSHPTLNRYLDFLEGVYLVRRLPAWSGNLRKRLVKAPKVYWRDTGLLHAIQGVSSIDDLLAQPWVGASWEGFVIEQIVGTLKAHGIDTRPHYLRTSDGYEIDLILQVRRTLWAIEVKLTSDPAPQDLARLDKAADWIGADHRALVSKVPVSAMGSRTSSCTLPDLIARLIRGD